MSTVPNNDLWEYVKCVVGSDRDPDVEGYAVRLSLFVANVCLAILIKWSAEDVESSVYVIFMQNYTLLLVTFISLGRQTFSVADAHFALTPTMSPLAVYLVYSTVRWLFNYRSSLYLRLGSGSGTKLVATLTCGMVLQWVALEILMYGAPDHVFEEYRCGNPNFVGFLAYGIISLLVLLNYTWIIFVIWPICYLLYTLRHIFDIAREFRRHQQKVQKWGFFRFVQVPWMWIRNWTLSNWIVVTRAHEWMLGLLVFTAYLTWGSGLGVYIPDMAAFYHQIVGLEYTPDSSFDAFSFGQLLAATVALEPLWEVMKLTWEFRRNLGRTIAHYPVSIWNGIVFIVTGHRNSWKRYMKEREAQQYQEDVNLNASVTALRNEEEKTEWKANTMAPGSGQVYVPTLQAHADSTYSIQQGYALNPGGSSYPN